MLHATAVVIGVEYGPHVSVAIQVAASVDMESTFSVATSARALSTQFLALPIMLHASKNRTNARYFCQKCQCTNKIKLDQLVSGAALYAQRKYGTL